MSSRLRERFVDDDRPAAEARRCRTPRLHGRPATEASTPSRRDAAELAVPDPAGASTETTPVAIRSRIVSTYRRRPRRPVLALELDRRSLEPPAARGQLAGHAVERLDERPELVLRLRLDAVIEVTGADLLRGGRQHLHRTRDALRQIQPHPRRRRRESSASASGRTTGRRRRAAASARAAADSPRTPPSCGARAPRTRSVRYSLAMTTPRTGAVRARADRRPRCESDRRRPAAVRSLRVSLPLAAARSRKRDRRTPREYSRGSDRRADVDHRTDCAASRSRVARRDRPRPAIDALLQRRRRATHVADVGRMAGEIDAASAARQPLRLALTPAAAAPGSSRPRSRSPTTARRPSAR